MMGVDNRGGLFEHLIGLSTIATIGLLAFTSLPDPMLAAALEGGA